MNVAIYGGSFDPPHIGHVMVVSHLLLNDPGVDSVLVIPCFEHKDKVLTPFEHRLAMCEHAFGWLPRVLVSTVERDLGGVSLTVRTLKHLKLTQPEWDLRFIMGSDLKDQAPTWEGWTDIERLAPPLYIGRAGIAPTQVGDPTPISPVVSSTIVRDALRQRRYSDAERYLPREVLTVIRHHDLYVEKGLV